MVRPVVAWWAQEIEAALVRNDQKGHWNEPPAVLLGLLLTEVGELVVALAGTDHRAIIREAADIAAFAMFLADRACLVPSRDRGRTVHRAPEETPHDRLDL